jgi:glycine hydroxymethyltransferase
MTSLRDTDPQVHNILQDELARQRENLNLIASENYASQAVLEALGSAFTDKYAEGYPGKRYYGGCENMDAVEALAIERAREVFKAEHVNVQPHAGAQANMAVYLALLDYGDTVLGMNLQHGGHLTHGSPVTFSGRSYRFIGYQVERETERIDFIELERLAKEHRPKLIVAGASAYPRIIDFERFKHIADIVDAKLMVDMAHIAGLIAGGAHPSPVPYADVITSTTHKTLRGPRGGFILCRPELAKKIDSSVFPGMQGGPLMHAIAAKAVCFQEALAPEFADYQAMVVRNAEVLADTLSHDGLRLVSGGTDNHMILVDLSAAGVTGLEAQLALQAAGIVANRNGIPFDERPPRIASGIRFGTPALTTRGIGPVETKRIGEMILEIISNIEDVAVSQRIKTEVADICRRFPVPGNR